MGHIREPKGVDFIIKSEPLTEQARKEISEFIREYANKPVSKSIRKKPHVQKSQQVPKR
jgi:hypothetical protein